MLSPKLSLVPAPLIIPIRDSRPCLGLPSNTSTYRIHLQFLYLRVPAHSTSPHYLSSTLINNYHPSRSLRSSNHHLLDVLRSKSVLSSRGLTGFRTVGPQIRNSHDSVQQRESIGVFRSKLETTLFQSAFSC